MPLDDRNVIKKKAAIRVREIADNPEHLDELYQNFVLKEDFCSPFVLKVIKGCSDNIIYNTILERNDEPELDPETVELPHIEAIPKAFRIVDCYTYVSRVLQNIFALGLLYGRSIYEQDMVDQIDSVFGDKPLLKDLATIQQALEGLHGLATPEQFEDLFRNIRKFHEEEHEEDRGPSGEEGTEAS